MAVPACVQERQDLQVRSSTQHPAEEDFEGLLNDFVPAAADPPPEARKPRFKNTLDLMEASVAPHPKPHVRRAGMSAPPCWQQCRWRWARGGCCSRGAEEQLCPLQPHMRGHAWAC
jgi:hypothetical protein